MEVKDVLVIGAGITGCAVALALAKRGLSVTMMTSSFDQRAYHAPFIQHDCLEEAVRGLQQAGREQVSCSRAYEQLTGLAKRSVDELLETHYLVDRHGNVDIHRCLREQLERQSQVEWVAHHAVVELLTLDQHSTKKADRYKKPACFGVMAYNYDTQQMEYTLAKEIILATGGAASLFPYSTHPRMSCGGGIAIAHQAGARLLNMEQVQFDVLGLFERDRPCFPLPVELLKEGQLYATKSGLLEISDSKPLLPQLYEELLKTKNEHLWLDLTSLDPAILKEKFPVVEAYCANYGLNVTKDPLPVVPVARHTCGGIAVDRAGQSSLQRLRALGEVACTGLFYDARDEALGVLESLTWAIACAEDIEKHLHKLVYYFPEFEQRKQRSEQLPSTLAEDWHLLRLLMWSYVGIKRDQERLKRGRALLDYLQGIYAPQNIQSCSIEQIQIWQAIQTAQLIAQAAKPQVQPIESVPEEIEQELEVILEEEFAG